jgi:murein DD-endopeptidase MepM/ murein hydrolase activator NlpD
MPAARRAPRRRQPVALPLLALRPAALSALALLVAACRGRAPEPAHPATPRPLPPTAPAPVTDADLAYLRGRALAMPVAGARAVRVPPSFTEPRSGGRVHEAVDIMAPRGTPVLAADDGRVWKVRTNPLGGLTVYAVDPLDRWVYYYAHLDRYHPGLFEGQPLFRGDTLGYVGTTGNAPPDVPHLHFQVSRVARDGQWWGGTPVDPLPYLREAERERARIAREDGTRALAARSRPGVPVADSAATP